jgi:hypothetical protein
MRTSDGVWVYPTWQFLDDGSLVPGASRVLQPFVRGGVDGWETAGWLESTFKELGGGSPRQHLLSGGDADQLVEMAQDAASRLSA